MRCTSYPQDQFRFFFQKKGTDNRGAEEFLLVPWIIRMGGRNMMTVYWITGMVCMRKTPPEPKYFQNRHIRDTRKTISKVLDYTPCQNKNPRTEATHSGRKVNNQGRGFHPLNSSIWLQLQVLHKIYKSTRSRGPIDKISTVFDQNLSFTSTRKKHSESKEGKQIQNDDRRFPLGFASHCQIANIILF